jgi:hypothetical protein
MDNKCITNIKDIIIRFAVPDITEATNVLCCNTGMNDELITCPKTFHCNTESVIKIPECGTNPHE